MSSVPRWLCPLLHCEPKHTLAACIARAFVTTENEMKSATVAEKMTNPSRMPRATHRPGHQPHSDDPPSNISWARLIVQMSYWSKGQHRPKSVPFPLRVEVEPQCQLPVIGTEDLAAGTTKEACMRMPAPTHRSLYHPPLQLSSQSHH